MIDIKNLRSNPDKYKDSATKRGVSVDIDKLLKLDAERTELIGQVEGLRAQLNVKGKPSASELEKLQGAKKELEKLDKEFKSVDEAFEKLIDKVPNLLSDDTPVGKDDSENVVVRSWGEKPEFKFTPKEHWEIGKDLGVIDAERAAEVSGSRFSYLKGGLAKLQFALSNFVIDILTDETKLQEIIKHAKLKVSSKPFELVLPPVMIRSEVLKRMARHEPEEDRYHIENEDLYLIGSAEHTLGPLHMDETLNEADLPIRYLGYSTAFRREAGSYGKDVRGILRVHQFDKFEMESFGLPEESEAEQDFFVAIQEYLLQQLDVPYQVVAICSGDMGDPDYRQVDIETWMPGQNKYRETHTADLMTDYQARRLHIKVRRGSGETELVHMNDATAMAIGRMLIAIMENYQTAEGKVKIPKVLQEYYGGEQL